MKLRKYQKDCKGKIKEALRNGHRKIGAILPTGAGKTVIFGSLIKDYLDHYPGKKVVVLSHLGLLITQTKKRFKKDFDIDVGILQGDKFPSSDKRCIISTMQSFRSEDKIDDWADKTAGFFRRAKAADLNIGMIIVDESHFAGCESYSKIIDTVFPDVQVVGFTATPFRSNQLMTDLFDTIAYTISAEELIEEGFLVEPRLNMLNFHSDNPVQMFRIIAGIIKDSHPNDKVVVYMKTIKEAEDLAMVLREMDVTAAAITSKVGKDYRDELIEEFSNSKTLQVLTTVDVLTAGFDAPSLSVIIMPYKVGSLTTYLQRVGRGLRPFKGKTHCDVYAGSKNPTLEDGQWEKLNKQMLTHGKAKSEFTYEEILEFANADLGREEISWTAEIVEMINAVKAMGLPDLASMINKQQFPKDMLDFMVNDNSPVYKTSYPISKGQTYYLEQNNLPTDMNSQEASRVIGAHKKSQGIIPDPRSVMSKGKYKGVPFKSIPKHYIPFLQKKGYRPDIVAEYYEMKQFVENQ